MTKPVVYIESPRHPALRDLHAYWLAKKGSRPMPARAEIKPSEIKLLLPDIVIWSAPEPFVIRIVGDSVVRFMGSNNMGKPATSGMPPAAAEGMLGMLNEVVASKAPRFKLGKVYWQTGKAERDFEASFLPLSANGQDVDMILGGFKFDVGEP